MGNCYEEMVAAFQIEPAERRLALFRHLDITGRSAIGSGAWLATGRVRPLRESELFEPSDEGGFETVLVPVVEGGRVVDGGRIVDVVAFVPGNPERWRRRTGAGVFLGADSIHDAVCLEKPPILHSTPLEWLRAECRGACIIDWQADLVFWFSGVRSVTCTDVGLGHRLDETIKAARTPTLDIRVTREAAGAPA